MKKITFIISMIVSCNIAFGQLIISNGEDTGLNWWQAGSTSVEIVDWHPKEANPSAKAMTIWMGNNSDAWSGGGLSGLNIDVNTYNSISVLVYKNVVGTVRLELQDGISNYFVSANYSTPGAWQKLDFNIPSGMGNVTTLLIAPFIDYDLSSLVGEQSRCFWDEVVAYNNTTTGQLTRVSNEEKINRIRIFNLNGLKIGEYDNQNNVPYNTLGPGVYIFEKRYASGAIDVEKRQIFKQ